MKTLYLLLLFVLLPKFTLGQEALASEKIKKMMKADVDEGKIMGVSSAVSLNGSTIWTYSYGYSNKKDNINFTPTTVSRIASITKPMTAIAIMQLVEQKKLKLDDKISAYLPEFKRGELKNITVKQLLQHTSGITEYKNKKEAKNEKEYATLNDALKIFVDRKLRFLPGTEFGYTTYGYTVLGRLIEVVSGLSYEAYLKKNIWNVAHMNQTSVENYGQKYTHKAVGYHRSKPGKFQVINKHNLSDRIPGGGVQSTVEDIIKFGNAILNNTFITAETLKLMSADSGLKKQGSGYGMGWYLYGNNKRLGATIGHNGAQLGCSSFLFLFPEKKAAVVVLSNTSGAMQEVSNIAVSLFNIIP